MDISLVKKQFPIFEVYPDLVYLDSAATSQKPKRVLDAINHYYCSQNANIHRGIYDLAEEATAAYERTRTLVKDFINAKESKEIIFTKGATDAINLVAYSWCVDNLDPGDVIVTTQLEHHSNLLPWLSLKDKLGIEVKLIGFDEDGHLDMDAYEEYLALKPKLVALTQMSNVTGDYLPIKSMIKAAKTAGAKTLIDACQSAARTKIDVKDLDCDFLVFSAHKIYGPTGVGVLYGRKEILEQMKPFEYGGGMVGLVDLTDQTSWADLPAKFEAGTPNIAGVVAFAEAINFMNELGIKEINEHDRVLTDYAHSLLKDLDFIEVIRAHNENVGGAISFIVDGVHPHDVAQFVNDNHQVCLRAGHHCCQPLMQHLGIPALTRMSFGVYTQEEDIDKTILAIEAARNFWN